jgi:hypothetical protein
MWISGRVGRNLRKEKDWRKTKDKVNFIGKTGGMVMKIMGRSRCGLVHNYPASYQSSLS